MDLFARHQQQLQERRERTRNWIAVGFLVLCILGLVALLWWGISQDRDFLRGDELFTEHRYSEALTAYNRSEQRNTWWERPQLTYRMAACYERTDQPTRAGDYYLKLSLENKGTEWEAKGRSGFLRVVRVLNGPTVTTPTGQKTPLTEARAELRRGYTLVLEAMKKNRAGVSVQLEQAYQDYKRAYETYVREIQQGLRRLDSEGI